MSEIETYQDEFVQKFIPWLEERWVDNNLFHTWVDLPVFLKEQTHGLAHSSDEDFLDLMALFHDIARVVCTKETYFYKLIKRI